MVVLKNIPSIISPELLYALAQMGHGDEIEGEPKHADNQGALITLVSPGCGGLEINKNNLRLFLADANFPSSSICKSGPILIRADGHEIPDLLKAILTLLPLDTYVDQPAVVMQLVDSDVQRKLKTPVWEIYKEMLTEAEGRQVRLGNVERFKFYDRARTAFAVVATGEKALYGNLILKKGVISSSQ